MREETTIFTKNFIILNFIIFVTYINIAAFFQFPSYLKSDLSFSPEWIGIIISVFSLVGLILRPLISPFINIDNAKKYIIISSLAVVLSLIFYSFAKDGVSMMAVRIIHGVFYVVLGTAIMTEMTLCIPTNQSAKAFSILGIITLIPFAVIPALMDPLSEKITFINMLLCFSIIMLTVLPLSISLKRSNSDQDTKSKQVKITLQDFINNIKDFNIIMLLIISFFIFTSFATTFFYIKGFAVQKGVVNSGWFFTISTLMEIGIRFFMSSIFDKLNKLLLLSFSLFTLLVVYFLLTTIFSPAIFFISAVIFGLSLGIAMPLLNSLTFDFSKIHLRALNSNLSIEMFQGGFFIGPLIGGLILSEWGYNTIFQICGFLSFISFILTLLLNRKIKYRNIS